MRVMKAPALTRFHEQVLEAGRTSTPTTRS